MHSVVDFKVDWPKLLFKSRPQFPCRDIIHVTTSISRRDINFSLCSFELVVHDVATSISCRDITLCLCRFQLVAHGVATSIPLSRHQLMSLQPSLVVFDVATSILCRDFNPLSRQ